MASSSSSSSSSLLSTIFSTIGYVDRPDIPLDIGLLKEIRSIYTTNSMVSTAVNRFKMYILRSGISIVVNGIKKFNFDITKGTDKILFDQELYPAITKMIEEWILYGFTCVSIAPSQFVEGAHTLVVLPWNYIKVTMQYNEYLQVQYKIETNNTANVDPKTKDLVKVAQFLCMTPPDEFGKSVSPIALCIDELRQYKKLWHDYLVVSHRLGHPVPIFNQSSDAFGILSAGTSDRRVTQTIAQSAAGTGSLSTSTAFHAQEDRKNQATRDALAEAQSRRADSSSSSTLKEDRQRYGDPLADIYVEPTGQKLDAALQFESPQELRLMCISIEQKLQQSLGLPNDENVYATAMSVEMYLRLLNMTIITFHTKAQHLLARPLAMLFNGKITASIVDEDTEDRLNDDEELDSDKLQEKINSIVNGTTVSVVFSTNPVTNSEQLTMAYHEDVIPYEQYVAQVHDYMNIQQWKGKGTYYSERQAAELDRQTENREKLKRQRIV